MKSESVAQNPHVTWEKTENKGKLDILLWKIGKIFLQALISQSCLSFS